MEKNELYHYGVLGMKWGIRRTPKQLGHKPRLFGRKRKQEDGEESPQAKPVKKKRRLSELSDEELRAKIARLELEKRYADLIKAQQPQETKKSESFIGGILKTSSKDILTQATTVLMGEAANWAAKKVMDDKLHGNLVNPRKVHKPK